MLTQSDSFYLRTGHQCGFSARQIPNKFCYMVCDKRRRRLFVQDSKLATTATATVTRTATAMIPEGY